MALIPDILLQNRYRVISVLGQGGMGSVYRALDQHLGVDVAVKENLFLSDEYARQFQREASILASVRHQALPRVGDYFSMPGQGQYLIMEYIEGEDLRQRIEREGVVPEKEVILIGIIICNALTYLHSRPSSVVHRDIKPGNIKITPDGEVVLVDFGLAKVIHGAQEQVTTTGARAMTPGYSPPEQYGTARTDSRSDIYSLGATLYAALTGTIPEDGLSRATGKVDLTPLRQLAPAVSRKIAAVIEKALEIEPEDRFQTAREFKLSLLEASELTLSGLENLSISAPPVGKKQETSAVKEEKMGGEEKKPNRTLQDVYFRNFRRWWQKNKATPVSVVILLVIILLLVIPGRNTFPTPGLFSRPSPTLTPSPVDQPENQFAVTLPVITLVTKSPPKVIIQKTITPTEKVDLGPTPIGGGGGQISFVSDRTGIMQVWTMNHDGSNQQQLTSLADGACQPTWSPDGKQLAVISPCKEKLLIYPDAKIYILNADGSNPRPVMVGSGGDFDPAWSPDGKRIAFTSLRTEVSHIFVYNFETATIEELSDTRYQDIHPTWSSSGKQLAFSRKVNFSFHIWVMGDEGLTQFQFSSSGNVNDYWAVWSPNGEYIVFTRSGPEPSVPYLNLLYYADRSSGGEKIITAKGKTEPDPGYSFDISGDSRWLAYESWPDGRNHDIYLMDIDGNGFTRLTKDPGFDFDPAWVPSLNP